jgi:large subunit ribosomal protein L15
VRPPPNGPPTSRAAEPRWKASPARLNLPFKIRSAEGKPTWRCNEDPKLLDAMYGRLLGGGIVAGGAAPGTRGAALLKDETKWLAVTHKTFDQGKRGFNERLAFYGAQLSVFGGTGG